MSNQVRGAGTPGKVQQQLKDMILSALVRKRDRSAAKSGELAPFIARKRNKHGEAVGFEVLDERPTSYCNHYTQEYRENSATGETDRVKVWENHTACANPSAFGYGGSSVSGQTRSMAGARKTGVSSFQTHTIEVHDSPKQKCARMVLPHKGIERRCGNWSARNHDLCKAHGGWDRKPKARNGQRVPLLPESVPVLAVDL